MEKVLKLNGITLVSNYPFLKRNPGAVAPGSVRVRRDHVMFPFLRC